MAFVGTTSPFHSLLLSRIGDRGMRHNLPLSFYSLYHHKVIAFGNMMRKTFVVYPRVVPKVSGMFRVQAFESVIASLNKNGATVVNRAVSAHQHRLRRV